MNLVRVFALLLAMSLGVFVRAIRKIAMLIVWVLLSGCATTPYYYTQVTNFPHQAIPLKVREAQIERGAPHKMLDTAGSIFSIPAKIIFWNQKIVNHHVSLETEQAVVNYLQKNNLMAVKVRINEYAPGDEWYRLTHNQVVGAGYRYTVGVATWLVYTIFPDRLFAFSDYYNPMTNTINIYSDNVPIVIHQASNAKGLAQEKSPGTIALLSALPFVDLYAEAEASNDAMSYFADEKNNANLKAGYQTLYPAYSSYIGTDLLTIGIQPVWYLGSVMVGHVVGHIKAAHIKEVSS